MGGAEKNESHSTSFITEALRDASAWAQLYWDVSRPDSCLRQSGIAPNPFLSDRSRMVRQVIFARKYAIQKTSQDPPLPAQNGRILVYEPDTTMSDGLAAYGSRGFLDMDDCPPWGLWAGYIYKTDGIHVREYLLSWIPEAAIQLVNNGDSVQMSNCFYWLDSPACTLQLSL